LGCEIFGIGLIKADFHWVGTHALEIDRLIRFAIGAAKTGADSLKNQDGRPSGPIAVGLSLSSRWNMSMSVTGTRAKLFSRLV
jgi:hypothetical protein